MIPFPWSYAGFALRNRIAFLGIWCIRDSASYLRNRNPEVAKVTPLSGRYLLRQWGTMANDGGMLLEALDPMTRN